MKNRITWRSLPNRTDAEIAAAMATDARKALIAFSHRSERTWEGDVCTIADPSAGELNGLKAIVRLDHGETIVEWIQ